MIDTITLRIYNIAKYKRSIEVFEHSTKDRTSTEMGQVQKSDIDDLRKKNNNTTQIINILKIDRTGDFLMKTQSGKKKNSSGNYEFAYRADWDRGFFEVEFSIPKYVYGTNVLMYVEHHSVHAD